MCSSRFVPSAQLVVLVVSMFAVGCTSSSRPAAAGQEPAASSGASEPAAEDADIRQAIDTFIDDPKQGDPGKIMRFTNASPRVLVVFRQSILQAEGASDDLRSLMLAAFAAGNARAQLEAGKKEDMPVAGVRAMVAVYKKVLAADPSIKNAKLDEYVARDADGSLEGFVKELAAKEEK